MLVVIGTDCIGSHKSNYHTITTITAPLSEDIDCHNQLKEKTAPKLDEKKLCSPTKYAKL